MPGTCNVICCTCAEDTVFVGGPGSRLQADSQSAEAASAHVTPVRPNIRDLVKPLICDHSLPKVSRHAQKPTMNTRADQAITTVAGVRMPRM